MRGGNGRRGPWATALATGALASGLGLAGPAWAAPDAAGTLEAFSAVESWTRAWQAPGEAPEGLDPEGATGACVTLRLGGAVLGRGVDVGDAEGRVWRAARLALQEATAAAPVERDARRAERLREIAGRVTVDLQVSGEWTPLDGDTFVDATAALSPGLDGVAARAQGESRAIFPGTMLATNTLPAPALASACAELGLTAQALGNMRAERGVTVYRFGALHAAQTEAGEAARFLHRGGRVRRLSEQTTAGMRALGERLAENLVSRRWPGSEPLGLMGTYLPWVDRYDEPLVAGAREQALAATALGRWSAVMARWDEDRARRLALDAAEVVISLSETHESEASPTTDPVACALICVGARMVEDGLPEAADPAAVDERFAKMLGYARDACRPVARNAYNRTRGFDESLSMSERAAIAASLAYIDDDLAEEASRAVLTAAPRGGLAAAMPWIGWAEMRRHRNRDALPSAVALREFRDLVWDHQLMGSDLAFEDRDLEGGIVFTAGRTPLPTAQTARVIAFLGSSLRVPSLTRADERPGHLARVLRSVRFLDQLAVGDAEMHMFRERERALGGVRLALWDQRQPLEATAMTLLAVAETLESLAVVSEGAE